MNSSTAIDPSSNSIGAYMVVSVGELRELLRNAEDAASVMRPDGNNYTASTVVLRLDVYMSDEFRSSRGEYQAQFAPTTQRQMLSQQFCDPTLSEPRRWTKPAPAVARIGGFCRRHHDSFRVRRVVEKTLESVQRPAGDPDPAACAAP